ncbi:MAG: hypothetical protein AB7P33_09000 [Dehalococcoidia bacterium]
MEEKGANERSLPGAAGIPLLAAAIIAGLAFLAGLPVVAVILLTGFGWIVTAALMGLRLRRRLKGSLDPAAALDRMFSPRRYGFKAVSGSQAGGGLYHKVELSPGERVIRSTLAFGKSWHSRSGYLTLTTDRLIFVGSRLNLGRGTEIIDLASIRSVDLARRFSPSAPLWFAQKAFVIETHDGKQHVFWPNLIQKEAFREEIRAAAGLDGA